MKRTNKIIAALAAVMMVMLMVAGCGNNNSADNALVAGTWKLTSAEASGMTLTSEMLGTVGMDNMTIEFDENGTVKLALYEQTVDAQWAMNGDAVEITAEGETIAAQLEDGKLVMEADGAKLIFEKQ